MERLIAGDFERLAAGIHRLYRLMAWEIQQEVMIRLAGMENMSFSEQLSTQRLQSLMEQVNAHVANVGGEQQRRMFGHLHGVSQLAYNELFYEFEQVSGLVVDFTLLPTEVIDTIINMPIGNVRLSERLADGVIPELRNRLHELLLRGFSQGWGYQRMARDIAEVAAMSYRRSMTIARTEGHRVASMARQRSQEEASNRGIHLRKMWIATLDQRTRDPHQELDGQTVGVREHFEIDGMTALQPGMFGIAHMDINCRCRATSFIEGYEPLHRRDNETGEIIPYANYREWVANKSGNPQDSSLNGAGNGYNDGVGMDLQHFSTNHPPTGGFTSEVDYSNHVFNPGIRNDGATHLDYHFNKHVREFERAGFGVLTKEEYVRQAGEFLNSPVTERAPEYTNPSGSYYRMNFDTGEFAIAHRYLRTYFIREHDREEYWVDQQARRP